MTPKIDTPVNTELMDRTLLDLDLRSTDNILSTLLQSQQQAVDSIARNQAQLESAVTAAAQVLARSNGRLVLAGAGASGRLAVQDGAEMWPTYGWPHERLVLAMAGGERALISSVEGVEDDADSAREEVKQLNINSDDVVVALAASGRSPWTVAWMTAARSAGAVSIGAANNADTPLLEAAEYPVFLDSGREVLAGSTRMAAGTAQKVFLNLFSTSLMIRLNRTYGNLMVDMAAVNKKLDIRRIRMLQGVLPATSDDIAMNALQQSDGWVKLAVLVVKGLAPEQGRELLDTHHGSLRSALETLGE